MYIPSEVCCLYIHGTSKTLVLLYSLGSSPDKRCPRSGTSSARSSQIRPWELYPTYLGVELRLTVGRFVHSAVLALCCIKYANYKPINYTSNQSHISFSHFHFRFACAWQCQSFVDDFLGRQNRNCSESQIILVHIQIPEYKYRNIFNH